MTEIKNGKTQFFPTRLPHDLKNDQSNTAQKLSQARHAALKIKKGNVDIQKELCAHYY